MYSRAAWAVIALVVAACSSSPSIPAETAPVPNKPVAVGTSPATAPPEEINAFVACQQRAKRREILLDTASRRLEQTVCGAALWFDGLFGERNLD